MRGKWFFWLGFFLPVNGLFEAIFFLGRGYRPDLNQVLWLTATYQSLFFLCASYAVLSLRFVWDDLGDEANGKSWCYRFAGLISIGLLLFLHAGEVYRFGQFEHEVHRNMLIANRQLPAEQPGNVRAEPIKIQARVWTYSTSFNALTRQQIDSDSLTRKARDPLLASVCTDPWQTLLLAHDVTVRFRYLDRNGQQVAEIDFQPGICPAAS